MSGIQRHPRVSFTYGRKHDYNAFQVSTQSAAEDVMKLLLTLESWEMADKSRASVLMHQACLRSTTGCESP